MPDSEGALARNTLLSALPADALESLLPKLVPFELVLRLTLFRQESLIDTVYFPSVGMISLIANLDDGMQAEVGVIGREGMLGGSLASGVDTSFSEALVQMPGHAWRMSARDCRDSLDRNAPFRALILRYNEALQAQVMQTAACNGRHALEQRFARWLLMAHDRVDRGELPLTQDFMAMMLGVHRPSITVIAGILQRAGLISYGAGRITVLDRPGVEAASCECYAAVQNRFAKLLGTAIG